MNLFYEINVPSTFVLSILLGIFIGVYFDVFRIIRKVGLTSNILIFAEDLFFVLSASVIIFFFVYIVSEGVYRTFEFLGIGLGIISYRLTVSSYIIRASVVVIYKIRQFFSFLFKNTVIKSYIYLDKFYKKGKIIIEAKRKCRYTKRLIKFFEVINEGGKINEQQSK